MSLSMPDPFIGPIPGPEQLSCADAVARWPWLAGSFDPGGCVVLYRTVMAGREAEVTIPLPSWYQAAPGEVEVMARRGLTVMGQEACQGFGVLLGNLPRQ